jgi:predicted CopG family antitoxin
MATKTLSVDEEAYKRLVRARQHGRESFSQVIKRAVWNTGKMRCGDLLAKASGEISEETLEILERGQREDKEPENKWRD